MVQTGVALQMKRFVLNILAQNADGLKGIGDLGIQGHLLNLKDGLLKKL